MSAAVIWIIVVVCVVGVAVLVAAPLLADRRSSSAKPRVERRRGRVQGGTHTGGGRSVAPRRDAPVVEGENPEDSSLPEPAGPPGTGSRSARPEPGSPLDL
jgi:hypothetical protein